MEDIVFDCEVVRVKTMADGSVRLELGMPEGLIVQAAALMQCQQDGVYLKCSLRPAFFMGTGELDGNRDA